MMEAADANSQHQHRPLLRISLPSQAPGHAAGIPAEGVCVEHISADAAGGSWDSFWDPDEHVDANPLQVKSRSNPWVSLHQGSMSAEPSGGRWVWGLDTHGQVFVFCTQHLLDIPTLGLCSTTEEHSRVVELDGGAAFCFCEPVLTGSAWIEFEY